MRAVTLLLLFATNFGCLKKNTENYNDRRPSFDPPIAIEQLDLNQFDVDEQQTETLSEVEEKMASEYLLESARLFYVNSNVKRALYRIEEGNEPEQSTFPVREDSESTFFEEEKSAVLLMQTSLKPEICNPQMSKESDLTGILTNGLSCPLMINSKVSSQFAFGKEDIFFVEKKGRLSLSLRPELLAGFNHKGVVGIEIKSEAKSITQYIESAKKGNRSFRSQTADGYIKLANGQSLPFTHQFQSVFSAEKFEDEKPYVFRIANVLQVKTVINGKTIVLTVKLSDGKKYEDSGSEFRCSLNNKLLSHKNCLKINFAFEHI